MEDSSSAHSASSQNDDSQRLLSTSDSLQENRQKFMRGFSACFMFAFFVSIFILIVRDATSDSRDQEVYRSRMTVTIENDGSIGIFYKQSLWLQTGPEVILHANNKTLSTSASTLSLKTYSESPNERVDELGSYFENLLHYWSPDAEMICRVKVYRHSDTLVFEQSFPRQVNESSVGNADHISSGWPIFVTISEQARERRGYAHWVSWFYENDERENRRDLLIAPGFASPQLGYWNSETFSKLKGGLGGTGVLAIFDRTATDTLVISPYLNPMAINHQSMQADNNRMLGFGVMGNVSTIPAHSAFSIIIAASEKGINNAMTNWGEMMRKKSGKTGAAGRIADYTLNYLGYTTDNGMYFYYNTLAGKNYYDTLLAVKEYASLSAIPIKYWLLDSWWYYRSSANNGVKNWTAQSAMFPNGLESLFQSTGLYVQAHNRYWSPDNIYASQNGGDFNFQVDPVHLGAVPDDPTFWQKLFQNAKSWGLSVYEQDWLFNELYYAQMLLIDVSLSKKWLEQMADAAYEEGISIQYCMPFVRFLLQSVEFPSVTQARGSDDYVLSPHSGHDNWRIGGQALLIEALGLSISKDGFMTSQNENGNPYGEKRFEPFPRLQSAVATISRGPVAIGDGIGFSDRDLVLKSCAEDGKLLQASTAAKMIDAAFVQKVFLGGDKASGAELWFSVSYVDSIFFAGYLFAADVQSTMPQLIPQDLTGLPSAENTFWMFESNSTVKTLRRFSSSEPLDLPIMPSYADFHLYNVVPILSNGWTLLGETTKWIGISEGRIRSVIIGSPSEGIFLNVRGSFEESVVFEFLNPSGEVVKWSCRFTASSSMTISSSKGCIN